MEGMFIEINNTCYTGFVSEVSEFLFLLHKMVVQPICQCLVVLSDYCICGDAMRYIKKYINTL